MRSSESRQKSFQNSPLSIFGPLLGIVSQEQMKQSSLLKQNQSFVSFFYWQMNQKAPQIIEQKSVILDQNYQIQYQIQERDDAQNQLELDIRIPQLNFASAVQKVFFSKFSISNKQNILQSHKSDDMGNNDDIKQFNIRNTEPRNSRESKRTEKQTSDQNKIMKLNKPFSFGQSQKEYKFIQKEPQNRRQIDPLFEVLFQIARQKEKNQDQQPTQIDSIRKLIKPHQILSQKHNKPYQKSKKYPPIKQQDNQSLLDKQSVTMSKQIQGYSQRYSSSISTSNNRKIQNQKNRISNIRNQDFKLQNISYISDQIQDIQQSQLINESKNKINSNVFQHFQQVDIYQNRNIIHQRQLANKNQSFIDIRVTQNASNKDFNIFKTVNLVNYNQNYDEVSNVNVIQNNYLNSKSKIQDNNSFINLNQQKLQIPGKQRRFKRTISKNIQLEKNIDNQRQKSQVDQKIIPAFKLIDNLQSKLRAFQSYYTIKINGKRIGQITQLKKDFMFDQSDSDNRSRITSFAQNIQKKIVIQLFPNEFDDDFRQNFNQNPISMEQTMNKLQKTITQSLKQTKNKLNRKMSQQINSSSNKMKDSLKSNANKKIDRTNNQIEKTINKQDDNLSKEIKKSPKISLKRIQSFNIQNQLENNQNEKIKGETDQQQTPIFKLLKLSQKIKQNKQLQVLEEQIQKQYQSDQKRPKDQKSQNYTSRIQQIRNLKLKLQQMQTKIAEQMKLNQKKQSIQKDLLKSSKSSKYKNNKKNQQQIIQKQVKLSQSKVKQLIQTIYQYVIKEIQNDDARLQKERNISIEHQNYISTKLNQEQAKKGRISGLRNLQNFKKQNEQFIQSNKKNQQQSHIKTNNNKKKNDNQGLKTKINNLNKYPLKSKQLQCKQVQRYTANKKNPKKQKNINRAFSQYKNSPRKPDFATLSPSRLSRESRQRTPITKHQRSKSQAKFEYFKDFEPSLISSRSRHIKVSDKKGQNKLIYFIQNGLQFLTKAKIKSRKDGKTTINIFNL